MRGRAKKESPASKHLAGLNLFNGDPHCLSPTLGFYYFLFQAVNPDATVEDLEDVKTSLISTRRIVFTPSVDVKDELKNTSIQITCLDEDGTVLKRVTSGDSGDIEDNENGNENGNGNTNPNQDDENLGDGD